MKIALLKVLAFEKQLGNNICVPCLAHEIKKWLRKYNASIYEKDRVRKEFSYIVSKMKEHPVKRCNVCDEKLFYILKGKNDYLLKIEIG